MPKAIVEFAMEVAVGIEGYALMQLKEDMVEVYGAEKPDKCECVKNDIRALGFQDWVESNLDDVPTVSGTYGFAGKASFDEDSADYSATCVNI